VKKILLLVDMQNGFARYEQTIRLKDKILDLLERKLFDYVLATRFINHDNSIYERLLDWRRLKSREERELVAGLEKHVEYVVDKRVYTCVNTDFIQSLCQLNDGVYPEEIYIAGADTDCCVLKIATDLFEHNIRPVILTRYCASNGGPASHEAGLMCLKRLIGERQLLDKEILNKEDLEL